MRDIRDYDLTHHNTFGISAKCRRFVEPGTAEEIKELREEITGDGNPLLILGGGSNLLLTGDYGGIVLHPAIKGIEHTRKGDDILVRAGSGETWDDIAAMCVANGWYGTENLSLIPGEAGASAVQNIGAYGAEIKDIIHGIEAVSLTDGHTEHFKAADCGYAYRHSKFKDEWRGKYVITHVTYRLHSTFVPCLGYGNIRAELSKDGITQPTAAQLREVIIRIRREKLPDPAVEGNAGSFFMNPVVSKTKYEELAALYDGMPHYAADNGREKIPAAWLIERCGWKGRSMGRAGVHSRQALVLVNRGGATGKEVMMLCDAIRDSVRDKFGIDILPEVNIV